MIFLLEGEINTQMVYKLAAAYNDARKLGEPLDIYLNSCGGDPEAMEAILDMIHSRKNQTTLTAYGRIYSCGFYIFFRSKCTRYLLPGSLGMCHYLWTEIKVNEQNKAYYSEDKALQVWIKDQSVWTNNLMTELGFTPPEVKKVKRGEEVYFTYSRLLEFMNYGKQQ